jgi:hypothetical protein
MKWVLLFCLLVSCVPASESFSATGGHPSQPEPLFESVFAGFFPENPSGKNLPIWKASLEVLEPVVLRVVQDFDVQFSGAILVGSTDDPKSYSGLKIHEVQDSNLADHHLQITLAEFEGHVSLGVFDFNVETPFIPLFGSFGGNLQKILIKALDAEFVRDQI